MFGNVLRKLDWRWLAGAVTFGVVVNIAWFLMRDGADHGTGAERPGDANQEEQPLSHPSVVSHSKAEDLPAVPHSKAENLLRVSDTGPRRTDGNRSLSEAEKALNVSDFVRDDGVLGNKYSPDIARRVSEISDLQVLIRIYELDRSRHRPMYAKYLLWAARKICSRAKGTPAYPEAALYLGLCHEYMGHAGFVSRQYRTVADLYREALQASPPPSAEMNAQLLYRVGIFEYLTEYEQGFAAANSRRAERLAAAELAFCGLVNVIPDGTLTLTGASMSHSAEMFLRACQAPRNSVDADVILARLEAWAEMLKRGGNSSPERPPPRRQSLAEIIRGPAASAVLDAFLQDDANPAGDRARVALQAAELYLSARGSQYDVVQHFADLALEASDGAELPSHVRILGIQAELAMKVQDDLSKAKEFAEQAESLCNQLGIPVPAGIAYALRLRSLD